MKCPPRALIEEHLRALKMLAALAHYRRLAETAKDPIAYLGEVLSTELERRHENGVKQRIAAAHLPTLKTLETFDFTLQANIPKMKILALADGAFIRDRRHIVLYGPPGTGKTHCLLAIDLAACTLGYRTLFTTAAGLLTNLLAKRDGTLTRKLQAIDRFSLMLRCMPGRGIRSTFCKGSNPRTPGGEPHDAFRLDPDAFRHEVVWMLFWDLPGCFPGGRRKKRRCQFP